MIFHKREIKGDAADNQGVRRRRERAKESGSFMA